MRAKTLGLREQAQQLYEEIKKLREQEADIKSKLDAAKGEYEKVRDCFVACVCL